MIFSDRKCSIPGVPRGKHEQHDGGLGQDQGHTHPHCRHGDLHIRQQVQFSASQAYYTLLFDIVGDKLNVRQFTMLASY